MNLSRSITFGLFTVLVLIGACESVIRVYEDVNFGGANRTLLPFRQCLDISLAWKNRISSINTEGGCIILFQGQRCKGRSHKIFPGTQNHHDFRLLEEDFNDKASSYTNCEGPNDNNIPQR